MGINHHAECDGKHLWGRKIIDCAVFDERREKCAKAGREAAERMRTPNPSPATLAKRRYFERHPEKRKAKKDRAHNRTPEQRRAAIAAIEALGPQAPYDKHLAALRDSLRRACKERGITVDEYWRMYHEQGGVCAICEGVNASGRRLHIDHCHDTEKVRGLLCFNCNTANGKMNEDPDRLRKAAAYIEAHRPSAA